MTHSNSPKTFRLFDLDSNHNDGFTTSASALSSLLNTTNEGLVDFDSTRQPLSLTTYHRYAVTLEHRPRRPVAGAQCSLQGFGRKSVLGCCQVPGGFKPSGQWGPRFFQNRTSRHRCLMAACGTDQTTTCLAPRLPTRLAYGAAEAIRPPQLFQIGSTYIVIGKVLHKLTVRVREIPSCRHARKCTTGGANRLPPLPNCWQNLFFVNEWALTVFFFGMDLMIVEPDFSRFCYFHDMPPWLKCLTTAQCQGNFRMSKANLQ